MATGPQQKPCSQQHWRACEQGNEVAEPELMGARGGGRREPALVLFKCTAQIHIIEMSAPLKFTSLKRSLSLYLLLEGMLVDTRLGVGAP